MTAQRTQEGIDGPPDARPSTAPPLVVPGATRSVVERLAELASSCGTAVALESEGVSLTFAALIDRMRAVAADIAPVLDALPRGSADAAVPVGVLAEQGADSIAAMMGVLAAGQPFVVLDSQLPETRLHQIAERAGLAVVLADAANRKVAETLPGVIAVRALVPDAAAPDDFRLPATALDRPASLIFTSGTTGEPKGVVYTNRTALACAFTLRMALRLVPGDRVALVLPQAFAAGQDVFLTGLLNGATLCIRDPRVHGMRDIVGWLQRSRVSTLHCTPSLMRALVEALPAGTILESVRLVTTAGEKVYGKDAEAVRPYLPPEASFMNWLGSSETQALTIYEIKATDSVPEGLVPAGRAVPLRELSVLGGDGTPVPAGEPGVLHVTSAFMSAGYWRDPENTARLFTPLPDGRTRFRTGDRARLDADGTLHLLGRADDAVKIRGYLVEPQEVESTLLTFPEVSGAVVRAVGPDDARRLVAWVVPNPHHRRTPSPASVRSTLSRLLPAYMVPAAVVMLGEIPRNERGKVAIGELPAPPPRAEPIPPATETERRVAGVWAPLLRLDDLGREDSFTALGGDSLAVEEMLAALEAAFGLSLTTADLAEHGSLAELSAFVDAGLAARRIVRKEPLVRLRLTGTRMPLFCFAGAGGAAALFEHLAEELGDDQPVYAFQVNGLENPGMPDWTVGAAARRYVRVLERVAPSGPVVLAGHSLGGLFALRVAQLLADRGREVPLIAMLDTFLPPAARDTEEDGTVRSRLRRSRPALVGSALYNFLVPTTIRRARAERRRDATAFVSDDPSPRPDRAYLRTRLGILAAGLTTSRDSEERKDVFNLHGIGIAQFHRPRPWHGNALIFLSAENDDHPRWWDALLPGQHRFHRIDASHVAVLRPPFVKEVAARLAEAMDAIVPPTVTVGEAQSR